MARLSLAHIECLAADALGRCGANSVQAGPTARSISDADAEGIRNVGLDYLPTYCHHLLCGKVVGSAEPVVRLARGATVTVDANSGFCHPAFEAALEPFAELTRSHGIALLTISRSYSAGVLGWMVERLAQRGFVALGFANSSALVAPWCGTRPMLGTNPLAFAAPRQSQRPLVIDMATSATAYVNVRQAAVEGRDIPLGWAHDAQGKPTSNANDALAGTIAPLGGAKGFALGLMVEILAAGVSGGSWAADASSFLDDRGGPPLVGQVFIAIDPARNNEGFELRLETMLRALASESGVRLPGDRRNDARAGAERDGVDVPDELVSRIEVLGKAK